jgi:hypothetical protein
VDKEKLNWRSFADQQGAITPKWCPQGTPSYYIIDHQGVIRYKWMGRPGPGERAIDAALEKVIQEAEGDAKKVPK